MTDASILVLEDDRDLLEVVSETLADGGWTVQVCSSYADLLARGPSAAAAVADFWGAGQDALPEEELRQIRVLAETVPLVLLTGRAWTARMSAAELGAVAILRKPFDIDVLLQHLESLRPGAPQTS